MKRYSGNQCRRVFVLQYVSEIGMHLVADLKERQILV